MNQDVRQDHTMRNAIIAGAAIVVGAKAIKPAVGAAGMFAGAKYAAKKAGSKDVANAIKHESAKEGYLNKKVSDGANELFFDVNGSDAEQVTSKTIQTKPKGQTSKPKISNAERLIQLEEFEKKVEKQIQESTNETEKKKLIKTLEYVKSEIAKLKLGGS